MLCRARMVLGLVMTFGDPPSRYVSMPLKPTQPGHPSVGCCNEYWQWFQPVLGKKWQFMHSSVEKAKAYNTYCDTSRIPQQQRHFCVSDRAGVQPIGHRLSAPTLIFDKKGWHTGLSRLKVTAANLS